MERDQFRLTRHSQTVSVMLRECEAMRLASRTRCSVLPAMRSIVRSRCTAEPGPKAMRSAQWTRISSAPRSLCSGRAERGPACAAQHPGHAFLIVSRLQRGRLEIHHAPGLEAGNVPVTPRLRQCAICIGSARSPPKERFGIRRPASKASLQAAIAREAARRGLWRTTTSTL